jgi:hypothetical protein
LGLVVAKPVRLVIDRAAAEPRSALELQREPVMKANSFSRGTLFAFALAPALALVACANQGGEVQPARTTAQAQSSASGRCPMARLNGVNATVEDTATGVAIRFNGPQATVDQLRANVHSMDDANSSGRDPFSICACARPYRNEGATEAMPESPQTQGQTQGERTFNSASLGPSGAEGPSSAENAAAPGQPEGTPGAYDVRVESRVDETVTGAVLTLSAKDSKAVSLLRDRARLDVRAMQAGCMGTPAKP